MMNALSAAQSGMLNDIQYLHNISNNLANSGTAGFKKDMTIIRPFLDQLNQASAGDYMSASPAQSSTFVDHSPGMLKFTGNPLDVALKDDGFFEVTSAQGAVYTRQGNFQVDASGRLVTANGPPVAANGGEIRLNSDQPVIDQNGKVWEGDKMVGQLRVVKFTNVDDLSKLGGGFYSSTPSAGMQEMPQAGVRQGYLEASNVVPMDEMVRMIETMRHFESSQRIIQSYDEMMDKAINVIGDL